MYPNIQVGQRGVYYVLYRSVLYLLFFTNLFMCFAGMSMQLHVRVLYICEQMLIFVWLSQKHKCAPRHITSQVICDYHMHI